LITIYFAVSFHFISIIDDMSRHYSPLLSDIIAIAIIFVSVSPFTCFRYAIISFSLMPFFFLPFCLRVAYAIFFSIRFRCRLPCRFKKKDKREEKYATAVRYTTCRLSATPSSAGSCRPVTPSCLPGTAADAA